MPWVLSSPVIRLSLLATPSRSLVVVKVKVNVRGFLLSPCRSFLFTQLNSQVAVIVAGVGGILGVKKRSTCPHAGSTQ